MAGRGRQQAIQTPNITPSANQSTADHSTPTENEPPMVNSVSSECCQLWNQKNEYCAQFLENNCEEEFFQTEDGQRLDC